MLVVAVTGIAQANFVINGDFATGDLTGWWGPGAYTQVNSAPSYDTTGEGYVAQIGAGQANGIQQMTSAVVEFEGQQFLLTADVGRIDYAPWHDFAVTMGGQVTTWPGPVYNTLEYVTYGPEDLTLGVPTHVEVLITATAATVGFNVYVEFFGNQYGYVDNIQLTAVPVPEPATLALLGLGSLVTLRRRRR